eukprot:4366520-Amphidinium_carterae.3
MTRARCTESACKSGCNQVVSGDSSRKCKSSNFQSCEHSGHRVSVVRGLHAGPMRSSRHLLQRIVPQCVEIETARFAKTNA